LNTLPDTFSLSSILLQFCNATLMQWLITPTQKPPIGLAPGCLLHFTSWYFLAPGTWSLLHTHSFVPSKWFVPFPSCTLGIRKTTSHRLSDVSDILKINVILSFCAQLSHRNRLRLLSEDKNLLFGMNPRAASATRALLRLSLCHWVCLDASRGCASGTPNSPDLTGGLLSLKAQCAFPRSVRISRTTRVQYKDFVPPYMVLSFMRLRLNLNLTTTTLLTSHDWFSALNHEISFGHYGFCSMHPSELFLHTSPLLTDWVVCALVCIATGRLRFATRTLRTRSRDCVLPVCYWCTFRKSDPILTD
jgi:hypothetical protein